MSDSALTDVPSGNESVRTLCCSMIAARYGFARAGTGETSAQTDFMWTRGDEELDSEI